VAGKTWGNMVAMLAMLAMLTSLLDGHARTVGLVSSLVSNVLLATTYTLASSISVWPRHDLSQTGSARKSIQYRIPVQCSSLI
jgi:hypothetical protein